ncbi:Hypothetical_protein [Hexamita inflata]|uniref:Hypothetical_protein n=1 Tax=Hexamita inflata TaxID=28002 RepID=A0AA86N9L8_9EUKA|nr:Hypothetical protein HINF_LOCUS3013 [Hexamita inflata]
MSKYYTPPFEKRTNRAMARSEVIMNKLAAEQYRYNQSQIASLENVPINAVSEQMYFSNLYQKPEIDVISEKFDQRFKNHAFGSDFSLSFFQRDEQIQTELPTSPIQMDSLVSNSDPDLQLDPAPLQNTISMKILPTLTLNTLTTLNVNKLKHQNFNQTVQYAIQNQFKQTNAELKRNQEFESKMRKHEEDLRIQEKYNPVIRKRGVM